jgi:hypothetical protein
MLGKRGRPRREASLTAHARCPTGATREDLSRNGGVDSRNARPEATAQVHASDARLNLTAALCAEQSGHSYRALRWTCLHAGTPLNGRTESDRVIRAVCKAK